MRPVPRGRTSRPGHGGSEVVAEREVVEQSDLGRRPTEPLPGVRARCGDVEREERADPAEVLRHGVRGDAGDGQLQLPGDDAGVQK